jgi:hypothetical protein
MAGNLKKKYIAKVGIDFDKQKIRLEVGDSVPVEKLGPELIKQLLDLGDIEEVGEKK